MVALESAVPLLTVAVASAGIGLLAAQLFLESQLGYSLQPPGAGYYGLVLAGLAVALGIIASTLPLLRRITAALDPAGSGRLFPAAAAEKLPRIMGTLGDGTAFALGIGVVGRAGGQGRCR